MFLISELKKMAEKALSEKVTSLFRCDFIFSNEFTMQTEKAHMNLLTKIMKFIEKYDKSMTKFLLAKNFHYYDIITQLSDKSFFVDNTKITFMSKRVKKPGSQYIDRSIKICGIHAYAIDKLFKSFQEELLCKSLREGDEYLDMSYSDGSDNSTYIGIPKCSIPSISEVVGPGPKLFHEKIKLFLNSEKIYKRNHIPYTMNILLTGSPGTGKTTCVKALGKEYDFGVVICNSKTSLSDFCIDNGFDFSEVRLVVFEEIDEIISTSNKNKKENKLEILLQYLDGLYTPSNVINILTTNYPERLDPRLLRKGRIDYTIRMENLSYEEAMGFKERFHLTEKEMSGILKDMGVVDDYNPAEVESYVIDYIRKTKLPK